MIEKIDRRKTRVISVGNVKIGGDNPISVQTMTNTNTEDIKSTISLIKKIEDAGCDIVRVSCPTRESTTSLKEIIKNTNIPIIADIHFNYKRAIESIEAGAHCIRINPGNIDHNAMREIIFALRDHENVAVRIGINSGSLERNILEKYGEPNYLAIVESAVLNARRLEDLGFHNFKISVKSSNVISSIKAYRELSRILDYPLHLGITEAGPLFSGTIKSSIGIGSLLADGIGDTIRVSLSDDPIEEIKVGKQILKSLGLLKDSINMISCPTCSRTMIDVINLSKKIDDLTRSLKISKTISILGCVVNGVGEAHQSDIGIFGFKKGIAKIYRNGTEYKTCEENEIIDNIKELLKL